MAYNQIKLLGMNERVGNISFPADSNSNEFASKPYSKKLQKIIDEVRIRIEMLSLLLLMLLLLL
jgi:ATP-dependent Zn protease